MRGLRLLARVPSLLRRPVNASMAQAVLRSRRETRQADFLALVRRAAFGQETSPYRRLFALAGCAYADLERMVDRDGVESTLTRLADQGVFLTVDEAKGRRPVVRGSTTFDVAPASLANPLAASHLVFQSSGSRGSATSVSVDIRHFRDRAVNARLVLERTRGDGVGPRDLGGARGRRARRAPPARRHRRPDRGVVLPGRSGEPGARSALCPDRPGPPLGRACRRHSAARSPSGRPSIGPQAVGAWMRRRLDAGQTPHLVTFPSSALALCDGARAAGLDLAGSRMSIGGEPVTPTRLAAIRAAGVDALPHYGSMEAGRIGEGCLDPVAPDELHVFDDLHAVVPAGPVPGGALPPNALLVSSLRPTAPLMLLNVSLGDEGVLTRRRCGCPLEDLGWTTHLHTVRSFEKLTAGGMTLLDVDAVATLEEVLPARFGGSPADYQLVEEDDASGRPGLVLLVSPRVGAVDRQAVAAAFLDRVGAGTERRPCGRAPVAGRRAAPRRGPGADRRALRQGAALPRRPARPRVGRRRRSVAMIPYARLRALLAGWPKYPACQPVRRAPLVTAAFPGGFNLSSTEHHWVRELGGYLDWDRDYVFTTIQSCVRLADFALLPTPDGARYLGVFEMGDLSGEIALRARPDYGPLQRWQIAELVRLLGTLGIPPARIHATYSAGDGSPTSPEGRTGSAA